MKKKVNWAPYKTQEEALAAARAEAPTEASVPARGERVPLGAGVGIYGLSRRFDVHGQEVAEDLEHLVELVEGRAARLSGDVRRLDLSPDYQRPAVWTDQQAALFVGSWLEGLDLPKIYVQRYQSARTGGHGWFDRPLEVVDGQQRLRSLYRWATCEVPAELSDGRLVWYADTDAADRRRMDVRVTYVDLARADQLRLYVRLNRGGTAHTDAEVEKARALLAECKSDPVSMCGMCGVIVAGAGGGVAPCRLAAGHDGRHVPMGAL